MSQSLSVIVPVFNRDPRMVNYVINDLLKQDIDEVVIANTGLKRLNFKSTKVTEVHKSLPIFYPGITRNMGAIAASGKVQVNMGADLITVEGSWAEFRALTDLTTARTRCGLLNAPLTADAYRGVRKFPLKYHTSVTAVYGMTKWTAMFLLKGPYDWEMRKWGWVDVDVNRRVAKLKLVHRVLNLKTVHLHHFGGTCDHARSKKDSDCIRNSKLRDAKALYRGWWSNIIEPMEGK